MSVMKKLQRKSKKMALSLAARPLKREGFSGHGARLWLREQYRDRTLPATAAERREAHKAGFTLETYRHIAGQDAENVFSQRQYLSLYPFNNPRNWLTNRIIARRFVPKLTEHIAEAICTVFGSRGNLDVMRLGAYPSDLGQDDDALLELIRRQGEVRIVPIRWDRGQGRAVRWDETTEQFLVDGWPTTEDAVLDTITGMTSRERCAFMAFDNYEAELGELFGVKSARLRLYVAKHGAGDIRVTDVEVIAGDTWEAIEPSLEEIEEARAQGVRRGWGRRRSRLSFREQRHEIVIPLDLDTEAVRWDDAYGLENNGTASLPGLATLVQQVEDVFDHERVNFGYLTIDVVRDSDGNFVVRDLSTFPRYPRTRALSRAAVEYLNFRLGEKEEELKARAERSALTVRAKKTTRRIRRRVLAFQLRSEGFTARMAKTWVRRVDRDRRRNQAIPAKVREQAYEWGFLPDIVKRFKITEENHEQFISERDYRFVQPLNGKYGKWVRDRVSALTVFEPHQELFEPTHYQVVRRDSQLQIIPLSVMARAYGATVEGLGRFLADRGDLTLASSAWSGRMFATIRYEEPNFIVDDIPYSVDEFERLLAYRVRDQFYVLIEPAGQDATLAELSSTGETEIQITMMNPEGSNPQVAEAFVIVTDEVLESNIEAILADDGTADAGLESDLAQAEHREDMGSEGSKRELDDARVETDEDEPEVLRQKFFSRVDPVEGTFAGAKTVHDRKVQSVEANPTTGVPFAGTVQEWDRIVAALQDLCRFAPQLAFVEFKITMTGAGPKITGISSTPTYSTIYPFSPTSVEFLRGEVQEKHKRDSRLSTRLEKWFHNAKRTIRKRYALALYPEGLVPYQSVRWIGDMRRDLMERNGVPLRTKFWAYRNGFLSYRIPQYGITPENREQFISDLEYRWLRHINKKYKYWLEDKISIKYVAADHNECLPGYYFYTSLHGGKNHVIPMMDCPEGYEATFEDVLRLAREKGLLALKPDEGSHGEGFFRLAYEDGQYTLNGEVASEERVLGILQDPANQYLVTEFIVMHPTIAEIYPNSVNTIRMIVFKKDGITPQIGNAYMRIGSLKSGYVDNTAAGGMLAKIDVETGWFGDGQALENGRVTPCPVHPDTGVLIEGTVPNWEYAKTKVLQIAADLPQLEYLGFDLAITEAGIKLPEINRFPDYPRIDLLTPATIDYLLYKVESKKALYGYDVKPPRALISLPRRGA